MEKQPASRPVCLNGCGAQSSRIHLAATSKSTMQSRADLLFGDADEYAQIGCFDVTDNFVSAVENNPAVKGWSSKRVHINAKG